MAIFSHGVGCSFRRQDSLLMKPLLQNGLQPFIALGDHGFELALMDGEWQISYMIRHMACVFYKKTSSA